MPGRIQRFYSRMQHIENSQNIFGRTRNKIIERSANNRLQTEHLPIAEKYLNALSGSSSITTLCLPFNTSWGNWDDAEAIDICTELLALKNLTSLSMGVGTCF